MTVKHKRLSFLARWFRRCPLCGNWFALRVLSKEHHEISGTHREFKCSKCDARMQDWKPSVNVQFANASGQTETDDSEQPQQESSPVEVNAAASTTPATDRSEPGIWSLAGMLVLVAATHAGSYFILDGGWLLLFALSGGLSCFVYAYIKEGRLFVRRAVADVAFEEKGWIHSVLFKAQLARIAWFAMSFFFAGSFLLHANQMPLYIWVLVYLDAFIIFGLLRLTRQQVAKKTKQPHSLLLGRRYIFWLNFAALTLLICLASFFFPVADTRSLSLLQSATMGWDQVWQSTSDPLTGLWGGMIAAADAMAWNVMQQISQWSVSSLVKFTGWMVFFAISQAAYLWVIQSAMLGVLVVWERSGSWTDRILGKSRAAKYGWGLFYLLIIFWLALSLALGTQQQTQHQALSFNIIEPPAPEKVVIDPCVDIAQHEMKAATQTLDQQISQEQRDYTTEMDPFIDAQVDQAFAHAEKGVDAYLDWYFTVAGEWQRLATVVVSDVGALMHDKMTKLVVNDSGFNTAIQGVQSNLSKHATDQFTRSSKKIINYVRQQVEIHPCSTNQQIDVALPSLSHDMKRLALTATTTAAAGAAIAMTAGAAITTKLAATASAKIAAKILAKAAAKTAAKAAGGAAAAGSGALAGLSCGPYAWVCSPAFAIAGFFGVDALFMEGDEMLNRGDMRKEMIQALMDQRDQIKARQKANYHKAGDVFFSHVSEKSHAYFTPARDGV